LSGGVDSLADLLRLGFILMMIPGANRGIDEAAKKEEEADEKYDTGHATVKSMSFSHTVCLTHKGSYKVSPIDGRYVIKAQSQMQVNSQ